MGLRGLIFAHFQQTTKKYWIINIGTALMVSAAVTVMFLLPNDFSFSMEVLKSDFSLFTFLLLVGGVHIIIVTSIQRVLLKIPNTNLLVEQNEPYHKYASTILKYPSFLIAVFILIGQYLLFSPFVSDSSISPEAYTWHLAEYFLRGNAPSVVSKPEGIYLFGFLFIGLISSAFVMDYNLKYSRVLKLRNLPAARRYLTLTERFLISLVLTLLFIVFINIILGPVPVSSTDAMSEIRFQRYTGFIAFYGTCFWTSGDYTRKVKKKGPKFPLEDSPNNSP